MDTHCFFVVTGGPGSGKSSLIEGLRATGRRVSDEAGREIIRQQVAIGGRALPWVDPQAFAELMLSWEMRAHARQSVRPGAVFFDRGVPDVLGFLRLLGLPVPGHMIEAARLFRYSPRAFIAPHWPEIYAQDEERKQTPAEARRTCEAMAGIYAELGYDLVELPRDSVEARVRFVIREAFGGR